MISACDDPVRVISFQAGQTGLMRRPLRPVTPQGVGVSWASINQLAGPAPTPSREANLPSAELRHRNLLNTSREKET